MNRFLTGLCAVSATMTMATISQAAILEISVQGELDRITSNTDPENVRIADTFSMGDAVSVLMTVDTDQLDTASDDAVGAYRALTFGISIGDISYFAERFTSRDGQELTAAQLTVFDDSTRGRDPVDRISVQATLVGPDVATVPAFIGQVDMQTFDLASLMGDALPDVGAIDRLFATNVTNDNTNFVSFRTADRSVSEAARYTLTSVSARIIAGDDPVAPVPLPASAVLLAGALAGAGALRRR